MSTIFQIFITILVAITATFVAATSSSPKVTVQPASINTEAQHETIQTIAEVIQAPMTSSTTDVIENVTPEVKESPKPTQKVAVQSVEVAETIAPEIIESEECSPRYPGCDHGDFGNDNASYFEGISQVSK